MESGSLSEMLNRAEYIQKISSYDRKQLTRYGEIKDGIAESEKKLEAEHTDSCCTERQDGGKAELSRTSGQ